MTTKKKPLKSKSKSAAAVTVKGRVSCPNCGQKLVVTTNVTEPGGGGQGGGGGGDVV